MRFSKLYIPLILLGNGVQQAFYQNPDVLYISLHVHEGGEFYPPGPYGNHYHCGAGLGEGKYEITIYDVSCATLRIVYRTVNIPWPTKGMGDADYLLAFQHIVMPIAYEFDPDLVISMFTLSTSVHLLTKVELPLDSTQLMATNWADALSLHPAMHT